MNLDANKLLTKTFYAANSGFHSILRFRNLGVKQRATLSRLGVETASNSFHPGM